MAGLGLVAITGPIAMGLSFATANKTVDFSEVDPQGRAIADAAAFQMAGNQTVNIPTARTFDPESLETPRENTGGQAVDLPYPVDNVTWTGFDVNTFTNGEAEQSFEVHTYLLVPDLDEYVGDWAAEEYGSTAPTSQTPAEEADEPAPAPAPASESPASEAPAEEPAPAEEDPADAEGGNVANTSTTTEEEPEESTSEGDEEASTEQEQILEEGVTPYQLEVPVVLTDEGPRLAAAPSLAPWSAAEEEPAGEGDYSNFSGLRTEANTQTARQVGRWAVAYAEDDRETLLTLTGDSDPNHEYAGLGGWVVPDAGSPVQILYAISVNDGDQLLRVRTLMEDDRTDTAANENPYRMYADFDVLVTNPESATPQIVAWGAAGSGSSLSPYSNALEK